MNIIETPDGFPMWVFEVTLAVMLTTTLNLDFRLANQRALLEQRCSPIYTQRCGRFRTTGHLEDLSVRRQGDCSLVLWAAVKIPMAVLSSTHAHLRAAVKQRRSPRR